MHEYKEECENTSMKEADQEDEVALTCTYAFQ